MFDLFFDTPTYRPVYVISDSEMKELQRTQNQDERCKERKIKMNLKRFVIKRKNLKKHTKLKLSILMQEKKS